MKIVLTHKEHNGMLYHYTKSNGINGIIHNNCFWATKSDFLNDQREFLYIENILHSVAAELIKDDNMRNIFLHDILENEINNDKEYFVLSFSNSRDSITMWSEFGNKTGYNIGFKSEKIIERIDEKKHISYHGFVIYDIDNQRKIVRELLEKSLPKEMNLCLEDIIKLGLKDRNNDIYLNTCKRFRKSLIIWSMFFKMEAFKEEQEYRFVFKKEKHTKVYFREKDGFMIPYIQIQLTDELLPIKEIIVAPQNHIDLAEKGMKYMLEEKGYDVSVSLSEIKLRY